MYIYTHANTYAYKYVYIYIYKWGPVLELLLISSTSLFFELSTVWLSDTNIWTRTNNYETTNHCCWWLYHLTWSICLKVKYMLV